MSDPFHPYTNSFLSHLYCTDAVFHTLIVEEANKTGLSPQEVLLLIQDHNTVSRLSEPVHMKKSYENLMLSILLNEPYGSYKDLSQNQTFAQVEKYHDVWTEVMVKIVREKLEEQK